MIRSFAVAAKLNLALIEIKIFYNFVLYINFNMKSENESLILESSKHK